MKTIKVGAWDGEQVSIQIEDSATLNDALKIAGMKLAPTQQIVSYSNAMPADADDAITDGETYLLTGNQVSGQ